MGDEARRTRKHTNTEGTDGSFNRRDSEASEVSGMGVGVGVGTGAGMGIGTAHMHIGMGEMRWVEDVHRAI